MLEPYIRQRLAERDVLLMTHIVLGYPSFEASMAMVEAMVDAGVDLMELQIPFSEPMADGPVILRANAEALARGATVERCTRFAAEVTQRFDIPFLFMTYYNILFRHGEAEFVAGAARSGVRGMIVPDLPPEEGDGYREAMAAHDLAPVFLFTPRSSPERMSHIAGLTSGFVYCVARKGVTGSGTEFSEDLDGYLARCRAATDLPLALGFGVKDASDVDFLRGKVDIAVIGSETIRVVDRDGVDAVGPFIASLR